jgi:hypothetical protein
MGNGDVDGCLLSGSGRKERIRLWYCEGIDDVCRMAGRGEGREARRGRLEGRDTSIEDSL